MANSFVLRVVLQLFFMASCFFLTINSEPTLIGSINYPDMGTYDFRINNVPANITNVITQLKIEASSSHYSLASTDVGRNKFVAFFSCRYDFSLRACESCVADAVESIYSNFPSIGFFIVYEECILGCSNSSEPNLGLGSMGVADERRPPVKQDKGHYIQVMHDTLTKLISNAIAEFDKSSRYFALTTADYSAHETLYALAQCNPDISSSNCTTCLQDMVIGSDPALVYGHNFSPNCRWSFIFSTKELRRPWNFKQTYDQLYQSSTGTLGCSILGAVMTSIFCVVLSLKVLL